MRRGVWLALLPCLLIEPLAAERPLVNGSAGIRVGLDRARTLGSVLMIAAHPDDENTAFLAYSALGRHFRTGYLSMTRGEGGQNLIGSEQGELMGLIRTQELLAARRLDGADQFFTRAIDFGFSKTADETLAKWGRGQALGDVVWVIRRFQPDVIVARFSGTPRDGHGQHQSSAMLAKEAFEAAADPAKYPEQLQYVKPWRARRLLWNVFTFGRQQGAPLPTGAFTLDMGEFNPLLGYSYSEIAGMSRSMHRSQGMGSAERKGSQPNSFVLVAGEAAQSDLFDGIDATWKRLKGGEAVLRELDAAAAQFDVAAPERIVPQLLRARALALAIDDPWAKRKAEEIENLVVSAAGVWLDASAARPQIARGGSLGVRVEAVSRSKTLAKLMRISIDGVAQAPALLAQQELEFNKPVSHQLNLRIPADAPLTQPYWLEQPAPGATYSVGNPLLLGNPESPPALTASLQVAIAGVELNLRRPVIHRWVDDVRGELTRSVVITPPVTIQFSERSRLFAAAAPQHVEITIRAQQAKAAGKVQLEAPPGWSIEPPAAEYKLTREGDQQTVAVRITPPAAGSEGYLRAAGHSSMRVIQYDHIPPQTVFTPAVLRLVRADIRNLSRRIGYVMGAGDDVPQALRQWGAEVTLLFPADLASIDLAQFNAIVTGVRAYNVRDDLRANQTRLLDYVKAGGTMVVQYNTQEGGPFGGGDPTKLERMGPHPFKISRDRITFEDAAMTPVSADHPLLTAPNRITAADYEGWVQERGLYYASEWDPQYQPVWESADPGEKPMRGGTLYARYGNGVYIFTPLSWFRQLPAGVAGAHRIFANIVSAGAVVGASPNSSAPSPVK